MVNFQSPQRHRYHDIPEIQNHLLHQSLDKNNSMITGASRVSKAQIKDRCVWDQLTVQDSLKWAKEQEFQRLTKKKHQSEMKEYLDTQVRSRFAKKSNDTSQEKIVEAQQTMQRIKIMEKIENDRKRWVDSQLRINHDFNIQNEQLRMSTVKGFDVSDLLQQNEGVNRLFQQAQEKKN